MRLPKLTKLAIVAVFLLAPVDIANGRIVYVDADAPGPTQDGTSWATAYNFLQDALADANSSDDVNQIRVAQGIYKPDQNSLNPGGSGDRTATFQLVNGVALRGGYAGFREPEPDARDVELYETILSGDVRGNDVDVADARQMLGDRSRHDNSHHVVLITGTDATAILDGFVVRGGNSSSDGGGIYCAQSSLTIANCIITHNTARRNGGGIVCSGGSPILVNCTIEMNAVGRTHVPEGGGVYGWAGPVTNCVVQSNFSEDLAGGISRCSGPITDSVIANNVARRDTGGLAFCNGPFVNCIISGNRAETEDTGGLGCCGDLIGCVISGNEAARDAGAMGNCHGIIANCIISGNRAGSDGGALRACNAFIFNCTIVGNHAAGHGAVVYHSDAMITNSILCDNRSPDGSALFGCPVPTYSCVDDMNKGIGCIGADPCFAVAGYWDSGGTPGDMNDDLWVDGDYHLRPESACIDAGRYYYCMRVPCTDCDGNTRLAGSEIDMGCYEFGASADSDGDWLPDGLEPDYSDSPDRDDDGISDGLELLCGTDPNAHTPLRQWNVPADVETIQKALFFSRDNELIVLSKRVYHENIYVAGRNVVLRGTDPSRLDVVQATIINGDSDVNSQTVSGRVITLSGKESSNCAIVGVTVTGGRAFGRGGGIGGGASFCARGRPMLTIRNCIIRDNTAQSGGGLNGLYGLIDKCIIKNNVAEKGGGLSSCSGTIRQCAISHNRADSGGGLNGSGPIIQCAIVGNSAVDGGGVYYCKEIANSIIHGNTALNRGGGIVSNRDPVFNCLVSGNSARLGGGACSSDAIINCTIAGNRAYESGGGLYGCGWKIIGNCIIWDNEPPEVVGSSAPIYSCVQGGSPGPGNISADPCFVRNGSWDSNDTPDDANDDFWAEGDYHLLAHSPCIDAGNNDRVPPDTFDLDADGDTSEPLPVDLDAIPRIFDGDGDGNSVVDMGAYEFIPPPVECQMHFTPQAINPGGRGKWVKAHFILPEACAVEDVDANTPCRITEPFEPDIESEYMNVFANDDGLVEIETAFERSRFCQSGISDEVVEVRVEGQFVSGQGFFGTDTIKVTDNTFRDLAVLASYWLQELCGEPDWCGGSDINKDSAIDFADFVLLDGCCIEIIR